MVASISTPTAPGRSVWLALVVPVLFLFACSPDRNTANANPAQELTDAEIAHIAVTANAIDAEVGEFARERASDPEVVRFADRMIAEHTAVNEQAAALAERLGVTPEDNEVSRSLREDAAEARTELSALSGAEFDRAYIAHEVAYHEAVLEALDGALIPGATNAELRALLESVRPVIVSHAEHARHLADTLAQAPYDD